MVGVQRTTSTMKAMLIVILCWCTEVASSTHLKEKCSSPAWHMSHTGKTDSDGVLLSRREFYKASDVLHTVAFNGDNAKAECKYVENVINQVMSRRKAIRKWNDYVWCGASTPTSRTNDSEPVFSIQVSGLHPHMVRQGNEEVSVKKKSVYFLPILQLRNWIGDVFHHVFLESVPCSITTKVFTIAVRPRIARSVCTVGG